MVIMVDYLSANHGDFEHVEKVVLKMESGDQGMFYDDSTVIVWAKQR